MKKLLNKLQKCTGTTTKNIFFNEQKVGMLLQMKYLVFFAAVSLRLVHKKNVFRYFRRRNKKNAKSRFFTSRGAYVIAPDVIHALTLGAHAHRGLRYLVRVCVYVCVSVRSISATTSKSMPRKRYQRFIATRQREKLVFFFKKCSVQKLWRHLLTLSAFGGLVGLFSSY